MPRKGFLTTAEVERFLWLVPASSREIALELRNLVARASPHATESILWGGLSYHDPTKGGPVKGAICQIEIDRRRIRLSFIHGARLNDPGGLLAGDRLSKRYLDVTSFEEAPWDDICDLIQEAAALDPSTFQPLQ